MYNIINGRLFLVKSGTMNYSRIYETEDITGLYNLIVDLENSGYDVMSVLELSWVFGKVSTVRVPFRKNPEFIKIKKGIN